MMRDDLVYLVAGLENQPTCPRCAEKRFQRTPPDNVPHLVPIAQKVAPAASTTRVQLPLSDSHERPGAFQRFDKASHDPEQLRKAIAQNRRHAAAANAIDPKLKQLGGDR